MLLKLRISASAGAVSITNSHLIKYCLLKQLEFTWGILIYLFIMNYSETFSTEKYVYIKSIQ